MFIAAKAHFRIPRRDGKDFEIKNGYVGDIPEDVADNWLIKAAIKDGKIATPASHSDTAIEKSANEAEKKSARKAKKQEKVQE